MKEQKKMTEQKNDGPKKQTREMAMGNYFIKISENVLQSKNIL